MRSYNRRTTEQVQADIKAGSKLCCWCAERKDFSEFYKRKASKDGRMCMCAACSKEGFLEWRRSKRQRGLLGRHANGIS